MRPTIPQHIKLWQLCLPLLIAANLAHFLHNALGWIIILSCFLIMPGYLFIIKLLSGKPLSGGMLSLSVGISLVILTVGALLLNSLHVFGFKQPIQPLYIYITLDIIVGILLYANRSALVKLPKSLPRLSKDEKLFGPLFLALPILSIFGAIRLNNGASNILTMVMICMIGVLYIALIVRPPSGRLYPYAICMTSLAILFANSLRGWSITGHDIHHEYAVLSSVLSSGVWSPGNNPGDPYNACLSITLLPAVLAKITGITGIYIYKVVFQIIFAAIIPAIYFFARKFVSEKKALLAAFIFMTFPTFINDLPFLNRQEVAFSYFILLLLVNFSAITYRAKSIITVTLLLGLILSHYSSSYMTISVILLALIIYKVGTTLIKSPGDLKIPLLSVPIVTMAFLATFAWNVQITSSSSNLSNTIAKAVNGILGKDEAASSNYSLVPKAKKSTPAQEITQIAARRDIPITYTQPTLIPLTVVGKYLAKYTNVASFNTAKHSLIARILQILVVFGLLFTFLSYLHKRKVSAKDLYMLSIGGSFLAALVLFTFVPQLSIGYDVTRLFQQSLAVLWMPILLFLGIMFAWLGTYKKIAIATFLVLIYLNLSGFATQLTGGYLPNLALNNSGLYYNFFTTHKSDVTAAKWLGRERLSYMTVFMDINSAMPPAKYSVALGIPNGKSQGYYYTDYTNNTTGRYRTILSSGFAEYQTPTFTEQKSLIYSNGDSKIYFTWPNQVKNQRESP